MDATLKQNWHGQQTGERAKNERKKLRQGEWENRQIEKRNAKPQG
jgi:hypothetical protein